MDGTMMLICPRVADFVGLVLPPTAFITQCVRCSQDVYADSASRPHRNVAPETPRMCTRCVVSDPAYKAATAPEVIRQCLRMHEFIDRHTGNAHQAT